MKVCISSTGRDVGALVDPRFGRCQMFLFVDTETMQCEAVENPAMTAGGGAGTQAAQLAVDKGVLAVITGNIGPKAFSVLDAAGIKMYVGVSGTVQRAVEQFKNGDLPATGTPSVARHSGMGAGKRI